MRQFILAALMIASLSGIAQAKILVGQVENYEDNGGGGKNIIRVCKKAGSKKKPILQCETINLDEVSSYCKPPKFDVAYQEAAYASGCCFQKGKSWEWRNNCLL